MCDRTPEQELCSHRVCQHQLEVSFSHHAWRERIDAMKARFVPGRIIRGLLIIFALLGAPHLLRVITNSPSLNDLYPVWLGSRELLVHHRNPYSRQLNAEIQAAFYGAPLPPGDYQEKECCFAYPVYVSFLLAPGLATSFSTLSLVVLWFLASATAASVACWWTATRRGVVSAWWAIPLVVVSPPRRARTRASPVDIAGCGTPVDGSRSSPL